MTSEQQTADLLSLTAHEALERIGHDVTALQAYALALWISRVEWRTKATVQQGEIKRLLREIDRLRDQLRRWTDLP